MTVAPGLRAVPEGVVLGDCRGVLAGMPDGCIDLIYIDPPFGTGQVRRLESIRTGAGPGSAWGSAAGFTRSRWSRSSGTGTT